VCVCVCVCLCVCVAMFLYSITHQCAEYGMPFILAPWLFSKAKELLTDFF
jgi:hypothetical protein